ncbi:MAG TPA: flagellar filament capping protein FliD [Solirubrobacteraceae bacterium]|nr:flagellar filament capping protein FliD [Solirubrobacteraceae bacterium]
MSTQSIGSSSGSATSSGQYASGDQLQSLGSGTPLQVTGLASGLDTNAIVNALMASQQQQVTNLTNQQSGLTAMNTQLQAIQAALTKVANDARALGNPSLFANTQTITSTNPTLVGATATSSNGAVVGGYQVSVTALASASQKTFSFTSQSSADTVTIDGQSISLAAGASADDLVNSINSNSNLSVWATVTQESTNGGPATVVLSDRQTGVPAGNYIQVSDTANALADTGHDVPGTDAEYTINNGATQYSSSNTISGASLGGSTPPTQGQGATQTIPGVSLSLNGITGSTPVTVTVGAPGPSTQNIQTAVQQFVTDYNAALTAIQTQLTQTPSSSDPTQGTLFGDQDLQQLLSTMREQMDATVGGLTGSITSMLNIGVSTGAASGTGAPSQSSISGQLTLDATALTQALTSNGSAVKSMLQSWSIHFSFMVDNEASPGGTIDSRIQGDDSQISYLANQISNLQSANAAKQQQLVNEFAQMEAMLSSNQSTSSWLTSQIAALPTP